MTDQTRLRDFLRAGLARRVALMDEQGRPVMTGTGRYRRPKTRISVEDEEGRVIDLHALRTTLGTQLARIGVAPQIAQRLLRHSDYKTTLRHYTALGVRDTAEAIRQLPAIPNGARGLTATTERQPQPLAEAVQAHQLYPRDCPGKWGAERRMMVRQGATNRTPTQKVGASKNP